MKYTKEYIKKLDQNTIDFCKRWVWDTWKRYKITENDYKTKAQREFVHDRNIGIETAFDMLRTLEKYATGQTEIADEITLFDDNMRN